MAEGAMATPADAQRLSAAGAETALCAGIMSTTWTLYHFLREKLFGGISGKFVVKRKSFAFTL